MIPKIDASYVMVKGTDTSDLESGPGIYSETSFPGVAGTTAIAGHRTTYLAPFRDINELSPGNHILLEMPYAHFTYTVIGQRVVLPTDVSAAVVERRLHAPGAVRLHAPVQRRKTAARVRAPDEDRARRRRPRAGARVTDPGDPADRLSGADRHGRTGSKAPRLPTVLRPAQPQIPAAL